MSAKHRETPRSPRLLGDLRVDPELNEIHRGDETVHLGPTYMDVLGFLMEHAPRVVSADELLERFWADVVAEESTIHRCISQIRRALGDDARRPTYIATVPKRGYRVIAEVRAVGAEAAVEADAEQGHGPTRGSETQAGLREEPSPAPKAVRLGRGRLLAAVGAFLVLLGAGGWLGYRAVKGGPERSRAASLDPSASEPLKIAVLPFDDLSPEPTLSRMADGFQEDILTRLSKIDGLQVTSRTSTERYRGPEGSSIPSIGRELGVSHVVEGSVRNTGSRLRVSVQLIHAEQDGHLWAETYDGQIEDLFSIQSQVARSVASTLSLTLDEQVEFLIDRVPTSNLKAYELVVQSRPLIAERTGSSLSRAEAALEAALALDPEIAEANANLAQTLLYQSDSFREWAEVRERATAAAERAVALDPGSATVLAVRAEIAARESDLALASELFERALELEPNHSRALSQYAYYLYTRRGRIREALLYARRALLLDPLSGDAHYHVARPLIDLGSVDEAVGIIDRGLAVDPAHGRLNDLELGVHLVRGEWLELLGRLEEILRGDPENLWYASYVGVILRGLDANVGQLWVDRLEALSPTHSITYEAQRDTFLLQRDAVGLARLLEQYRAMNTDRVWAPTWEGIETSFGMVTEVALLTLRAEEAHVRGSTEEERALRSAAIAVMADSLIDDRGDVVISALNAPFAFSHAVNLRMLGRESESRRILRAIADYQDVYNEVLPSRLRALALLDIEGAIELARSRALHVTSWTLDEIAADRMGLYGDLAEDPRFVALRQQTKFRDEDLLQRLKLELPELIAGTVGL